MEVEDEGGRCLPSGNLQFVLVKFYTLRQYNVTYIIVRNHLAFGDDLLVPFSEIILLCDIDSNQCSTLDLLPCQHPRCSSYMYVTRSYLLLGLLRLLGSLWGFCLLLLGLVKGEILHLPVGG